jgi:hypothetical protein
MRTTTFVSILLTATLGLAAAPQAQARRDAHPTATQRAAQSRSRGAPAEPLPVVVEALQGFTIEDSTNLERVEQAFRQAGASMLRTARVTRLEYAPTSVQFDGRRAQGTPDPTPPHEIRLMWGSDGGDGEWALHDEHVVPPVVGMAWARIPNAANHELIFVAVDGGRYRITEGRIQPYDPSAEWPRALTFDALFLRDVEALTQQHQLESNFLSRMTALNQRYSACVTPHWNREASARHRNQVADIRESTRRNRDLAITTSTDDAVRARCVPALRPFIDVLYAAIEARNAQRTRLYNALRTALRP